MGSDRSSREIIEAKLIPQLSLLLDEVTQSIEMLKREEGGNVTIAELLSLIHDVKNNLSFLLQWLKMISEDQLSLATLNRRAPILYERVVSEILAASGGIKQAIECLAGRIDEEIAFVNLTLLTRDIVEATATLFPRHRMTLSTKETPPIPPLLLHREKMRSALINGIKNGMEAMPERGRLHVTLECDPLNHEVIVEIVDQGSKEKKHSSFGDARTGVGMTSMRRVVEDFHGGEISWALNLRGGMTVTMKLRDLIGARLCQEITHFYRLSDETQRALRLSSYLKEEAASFVTLLLLKGVEVELSRLLREKLSERALLSFLRALPQQPLFRLLAQDLPGSPHERFAAFLEQVERKGLKKRRLTLDIGGMLIWCLGRSYTTERLHIENPLGIQGLSQEELRSLVTSLLLLSSQKGDLTEVALRALDLLSKVL